VPLFGIDRSEAMLARARARVRRAGLSGRVHLIRGDIRKLPFAGRVVQPTRAGAPQRVTSPGQPFDMVLAPYGMLQSLLRERDLVERAMVSTMEPYSRGRILELEPKLRRGWTYPKVTKDWTSKRWAKGPMLAALVAMRHRLPGLAAEKLPKFGVESMWVYHPLVSRRLARITELAGVELIAWTVDDLPRMQRLVDTGVNGLVSNDPRLFDRLAT